MIQPAPASTITSGIKPELAQTGPSKDSATPQDFSALLGIHASLPEVVDPATAGPAAALPALPGAPADPAITGKILPPALPVAAAVVADGEVPPVSEVLPLPKPRPAKPVPDHPLPVSKTGKPAVAEVVPVSEVLGSKGKKLDAVPVSGPILVKPGEVVPVADVIPTKPGEALPVADVIPAKPAEVVPVADVLVIKPLEPVPVADALVTKPKPAQPVQTAPKVQGPVQRHLPQLPEQASDRAVARLEQRQSQAAAALASAGQGVLARPDTPVMRRIVAVKAAEATPTQPAPQQAFQPVTPPAEEVRLAVTLTRSATVTALREETRLAPALPSIPEASAALPAPHAADSGNPAPVQTAAPISPIRPHDFTALIDRLSAAREALAPQAVSLTVAHQEFGPVRLHFRPEDAGLSVAMSSADPDFARAATAAPAPALPSPASEQAGSALNQRGDGAPAQQGGFAQSRGQSPERREQPHDHQHQQQGQTERRGGNRAAQQRGGIFA